MEVVIYLKGFQYGQELLLALRFVTKYRGPVVQIWLNANPGLFLYVYVIGITIIIAHFHKS